MSALTASVRRATDTTWRLLLPLTVAAVFAATFRHPYLRGGLWICLLVVSYDGWGRAALAAAGRLGWRDLRVDLGLRVSWGIAVSLFVGGIACMLHIATRRFLFVEVAVGWAFEAAFLIQARDRGPSLRGLGAAWSRPLPWAILALAACVFAVELAGGVTTTWTNRSDDEPLYYFLPQKLLDTGSFFDPYNVRRMTSYGGQFFLHAQFLLVGSHDQLNGVDQGVGTFVVLAHVFGEATRPSLRRARVVPLLLGVVLVATIDHVRFNIGSLMTVLGALLGTHRTWVLARREERVPAAGYLLVGMCCASACVLRTSAAPPVAAFLALTAVARALPARLGRANLAAAAAASARSLAAIGAATLAALLAWMALYAQSSGTWVYPLSRGNMTPGFAILKIEPGLWFNAKHILTDLAFTKPVATSLLLLLGAALPLAATRSPTRERPASMASDAPTLMLVTLFALVLTSIMGGAFEFTANARYYFGFALWAAVVGVLSIGPLDALHPRAVAVVGALAIHVAANRVAVKQRLDAELTTIESATKSPFLLRDLLAPRVKGYQAAQAALPPGARVVTAVSDAYLFDMKRNDIMSLDLAGGMGPAPGFPCFKGPEALERYLVGNGVSYVVAARFTIPHELYDLANWKRHKATEHWFLTYEAPFMVDAMESIDALRATRRHVYQDDTLTVIELEKR